MRLGAILNGWRHSQKLDASAAAEHMGLSRSAFARIEQGKVPDGQTLIRLWIWLTEAELEDATNGTGQDQSGVDSSRT